MGEESPAGGHWWPSLIAVAGCAALGASTLSIYFRDVAAQIACAGTIVCGDFRADPRALVAGLGFGLLALGLLFGTAIGATASAARGRPRNWPAPLLTIGIASSFAALITVITLNSAGAGVFSAIPVAIWAFLGIGYMVLWIAVAFWARLTGTWGLLARGAALVHGAVSLAATVVTLAIALGPGPLFM